MFRRRVFLPPLPSLNEIPQALLVSLPHHQRALTWACSQGLCLPWLEQHRLSGWGNLLFAKVVGDRGLAINPSRVSSKPLSPPLCAGHLIRRIPSPYFTQTYPCLLLPHPCSHTHAYQAWPWLEGRRCRITGYPRRALGPGCGTICLHVHMYRYLHPSASWCYPRHAWHGWGNPPLSIRQCRVPLGPCFCLLYWLAIDLGQF